MQSEHVLYMGSPWLVATPSSSCKTNHICKNAADAIGYGWGQEWNFVVVIMHVH